MGVARRPGRVRQKLHCLPDGDRQMVEILGAMLTDGLATVEVACAEALAGAVFSNGVVLNILSRRRPVTGQETLWDIVAGRRVTQFGTSPAYLALCWEFDYAPGKALDLAPLRSVIPIGSIPHDRQFEWVARAVKPVPVRSLLGGTDIIG